MNDEWKKNLPTSAELSFLKAKAPQLRQQAQRKNGKIIRPPGMIDPMPCVICGSVYDKYNNGSVVKHETCPECRRKLASGMACVVCRVDRTGIYEGRYAFLQPDENKLAQQLSGQVIPVSPETMDEIEKKYGSKN